MVFYDTSVEDVTINVDIVVVKVGIVVASNTFIGGIGKVFLEGSMATSS